MATSFVYRPDYTIKEYGHGLYKLIKFKRCDYVSFADHEHDRPSDVKLDPAISRARSVVLQLAMCNEWDYFFTGTLNGAWHDRSFLAGFVGKFTQFIRDLRKQPGYESLRYMLVPERHKDGNWHLHGLISGLPSSALRPFVRGIHPKKLVDAGYLNWPGYAKRFGFCSLGIIRNSVGVAFYMEKYISKDMDTSVTQLGGHTYYCSRGLRRAKHFGDVYGQNWELDKYLKNDYDFVSTGFVSADWRFWMPFVEPDGSLFDDDGSDYAVSWSPSEAACPEWEQMILIGFGRGGGTHEN